MWQHACIRIAAGQAMRAQTEVPSCTSATESKLLPRHQHATRTMHSVKRLPCR